MKTNLSRRLFLSLCCMVWLWCLWALSCTGQQSDRAVAILQAAQAGCVLLEGLQVDDRAQDVCVSIEEVREAVKHALAAKAAAQRAAQGAPSSSSPASSSPAAPAAPVAVSAAGSSSRPASGLPASVSSAR